MRSIRALRAPLLVLSLLAPCAAQATSVLYVDVPEMTAISAWVLDVRVEHVASVDLRPQGQGLFTDVRLRVLDVLKGDDVPSRYVMRLVGGEGADGLALTIPGMPTFRAGERVVVFLETTNTGHVPCGLGQGVWRIHETPSGPWAVQSIGGVHLMGRDSRGQLRTVEPEPMSWGLPLGRLVAEVLTARDLPPVEDNGAPLPSRGAAVDVDGAPLTGSDATVPAAPPASGLPATARQRPDAPAPTGPHPR